MATDWTDRLRLRNLRYLLSLEQTRNLSHSASLLNTTQPGLSKWLKELEEDVGLPLFERHARGLIPTPNGKVLIEHARRVLSQLDRAATDMSTLREGVSGRLAIGASGAAASVSAPMAILRMAERLPALRVDLVEATMDRLLVMLAQGELDVVIGRTSKQMLDGALISSELLYVEPVDLIARPGHPLFLKATVNWDDVERYRWIVWPRETPVRNALEAALASAGRQLPKNYVESNSVIANVTLLTHSDMIGTASHRSTQMLTRLKLVRSLSLKMQGFGSVSMYWRNDEIFPQTIEQALDCIRDVTRYQETDAEI